MPDELHARLLRHHLREAMGWLLVTQLVGLWVGDLLAFPSLDPGVSWLSLGRWRMVHTWIATQGVLVNGAVAAWLALAPSTLPRAVVWPRLAAMAGAAWQGVVAVGALGIVFGHAHGVEWAEGPRWLDPLATATLLAFAANAWGALLAHPRAAREASVVLLAAGWVWLCATDLLGNYGVEAMPHGVDGHAAAGLFLHDATGLAFAPVAAALLLRGAARVGKPALGGMAVAGAWLFAVAYPLNGLVPFLASVMPDLPTAGPWLTAPVVAAVVAATVLPVTASLRRGGRVSLADPAGRWIAVGTIALVAGALQGVWMATPAGSWARFSDATVAHAHLEVLGVAGCALFALVVETWPRATGAPWPKPRLLVIHFWHVLAGLGILLVALHGAAVAAAAHDATALAVEAARPWWMLRLVGGGVLLGGQIVLLLAMRPAAKPASPPVRVPVPVPVPVPLPLALPVPVPDHAAAAPASATATATAPAGLRARPWALAAGILAAAVPVFGGAAIAWSASRRVEAPLVPSPVALGHFRDLSTGWPEAFSAAFPGGPTPDAWAVAVRLGRDVYIREGCWHCHTQLVLRGADERLWGRPSEPGDFATPLHSPPMAGSRRLGPDLANVSGRHGSDWQLAHLFDPRTVVPQSVMPRYPWLFDGARRPTREALAVVAYLQSLGSDRPASPRDPEDGG